MTRRHRFLVFGFSFWVVAYRSKHRQLRSLVCQAWRSGLPREESCRRPSRSPTGAVRRLRGPGIGDGEAAHIFVEPPGLRLEELRNVLPIGVELVLVRYDPLASTVVEFNGLLPLPDGSGIVASGGIEVGVCHAGQFLGLLVGQAFEWPDVGFRVRKPGLVSDQLGLPGLLEFHGGGGAQRDGALRIRCFERPPDLALPTISR